MTTSPDPRKNQLLAALPEAKLQRWLRHLEYVELPLGEVLHEAGGLSHVYFPTTAVVSLLYVMRNGESAEIAVIGHLRVLCSGQKRIRATAASPPNGVEACGAHEFHSKEGVRQDNSKTGGKGCSAGR